MTPCPPYPVRPVSVLALLPLLLAAVSVAAVSVAADEASAPPTPAAIDEAIDRGVDWLLGERRPDRTWGTGRRAVGHTALAVFTLLHAGLDEEGEGKRERALKQSLAWLDRHGPGLTKAGDRGARTYDMALLTLVERARGRAAGPRTRGLVALLVRSQARSGQWSYEVPRGSRNLADVGDNSNAQFAVLALGAAVGEGVVVPRGTLERARDWWLGAVQRDGGFGYSSGGSLASASTGSMTAAGISSLAILEAALASGAAASDPLSSEVVQGAVDRLAGDFAVDHNFGPAVGGAAQRQRNAGRGWLHYYLWSVERAMVLGDRERLGTHDWYAEGAARLLETQKKDGSWRGEHPLYATSFALLFLTRAADPPRVFTPPDRPRGTTTPAPEAQPPPPPPKLPPGSVDDWLQGALPPTELRAACLAKGAVALAPLVHALGNADPKVRQRANEALRALLGDERVGRADHHPLARGRLRLWIRKNERFLVADEERFVVARAKGER